MNTMLYPELYKSLESVRWDMEKDIPWDKFDASLLTDEQADDDQDERDHRMVRACPPRKCSCVTTITTATSPRS